MTTREGLHFYSNSAISSRVKVPWMMQWSLLEWQWRVASISSNRCLLRSRFDGFLKPDPNAQKQNLEKTSYHGPKLKMHACRTWLRIRVVQRSRTPLKVLQCKTERLHDVLGSSALELMGRMYRNLMAVSYFLSWVFLAFQMWSTVVQHATPWQLLWRPSSAVEQLQKHLACQHMLLSSHPCKSTPGWTHKPIALWLWLLDQFPSPLKSSMQSNRKPSRSDLGTGNWTSVRCGSGSWPTDGSHPTPSSSDTASERLQSSATTSSASSTWQIPLPYGNASIQKIFA